MSNGNNQTEIIGKKVFFLYPHSMVKEEIIHEIIRHEYEAYALDNHTKAYKLLAEYPHSILFINIDEVLNNQMWEEYIKLINKNEQTGDVRIGIITRKLDESLSKKYIDELKVPCGYIRLKTGPAEIVNVIIKTLEENNAKGCRKYVRARCNDNSMGSFNIKKGADVLSGTILDISSVGMAGAFDKKVKLEVDTYLENIQLRLRSSISMATGKVSGSREAGDKIIYIVMFDSERMIHKTMDNIYKFLYSCLQSEIDQKMKEIKGD